MTELNYYPPYDVGSEQDDERHSSTLAARAGAVAAIALLMLLALTAPGGEGSQKPPQPAAEEATNGWASLFDRVTTENWCGLFGTPFPKKSWEVRDGCLGSKPALIGRDIVSCGEFEAFEFAFDWRVSPGGNTGVKYLVDEFQKSPYESEIRAGLLLFWAAMLTSFFLGRIILLNWGRSPFGLRPRHLAAWLVALGIIAGLAAAAAVNHVRHCATGLEMQLVDDRLHGDGKVASRSAGALYDLVAPAVSPANPAGEWNTGRIRVAGNDVEHWINGERVVAYRIGSADLKHRIAESKFSGLPGIGSRNGKRLALQHHEDEVWFRNLRLKNLPAKGP